MKFDIKTASEKDLLRNAISVDQERQLLVDDAEASVIKNPPSETDTETTSDILEADLPLMLNFLIEKLNQNDLADVIFNNFCHDASAQHLLTYVIETISEKDLLPFIGHIHNRIDHIKGLA